MNQPNKEEDLSILAEIECNEVLSEDELRAMEAFLKELDEQ